MKTLTFSHKVDNPLITRLSAPYALTNGLQNRHIALWQSHGFYYEPKLTRWEWQRARIFQTVEDLYTQLFLTLEDMSERFQSIQDRMKEDKKSNTDKKSSLKSSKTSKQKTIKEVSSEVDLNRIRTVLNTLLTHYDKTLTVNK